MPNNMMTTEARRRQSVAPAASGAVVSTLPLGTPQGLEPEVASTVDEESVEERERFLAAIARGIADADAGRVVDHATLMAQLRGRFGS